MAAYQETEPESEFARVFDRDLNCVIVITNQKLQSDPEWVDKYIAPMPGEYVMLNVARECVPCLAGKSLTHDEMVDPGKVNTLCKLLIDYTTFIQLEFLRGCKTFVICCKNGRSRSPTVILAFLILYRGFTPIEADEWLRCIFKTQRPRLFRTSTSDFPNFDKFINVINKLQEYRDALNDDSLLCSRVRFVAERYRVKNPEVTFNSPHSDIGTALIDTIRQAHHSFSMKSGPWHRPIPAAEDIARRLPESSFFNASKIEQLIGGRSSPQKGRRVRKRNPPKKFIVDNPPPPAKKKKKAVEKKKAVPRDKLLARKASTAGTRGPKSPPKKKKVVARGNFVVPKSRSKCWTQEEQAYLVELANRRKLAKLTWKDITSDLNANYNSHRKERSIESVCQYWYTLRDRSPSFGTHLVTQNTARDMRNYANNVADTPSDEIKTSSDTTKNRSETGMHLPKGDVQPCRGLLYPEEVSGKRLHCQQPASVRLESGQPLCGHPRCQPGYISRNGNSSKERPDIGRMIDLIVDAFQKSAKFCIVAVWEEDLKVGAGRKSLTGWGSSYYDCECDQRDCRVCQNIIGREDSLVIAYVQKEEALIAGSPFFSCEWLQLYQFCCHYMKERNFQLCKRFDGGDGRSPHKRVVYNDSLLDDFVSYTQMGDHHRFVDKKTRAEIRSLDLRHRFVESEVLEKIGWSYDKNGLLIKTIADLPERPIAAEPQPLPEERRGRQGPEQSFVSAMSAELDGRLGNENCAQRARLREFLSRPIEQIDRAILEEIGTLPLRPDGTFMYVYNIPQTRDNTYAFRATMWSKDYGLYCTERLAAIVARYAQLHPEKSREEVWADIGIVDLDNIDEATATRLYEERTGESNALIDRANQLVAAARAARVPPVPPPPPVAPVAPAVVTDPSEEKFSTDASNVTEDSLASVIEEKQLVGEQKVGNEGGRHGKQTNLLGKEIVDLSRLHQTIRADMNMGRESAIRLKECKTSLEYVICEVEELDWVTRVPHCTPDKHYYSSLRYFAKCLMTSRIVNRPKSQTMFAYRFLGKQWLDNYMDRIDASPDVLTKAAACQVVYYDGLRFRDELQSVASVLPALRQRTIDALEELQVKLGSLENWRLYQDEICKTGKSTTFANHAPRERFNVINKQVKNFSIVYKRPLKRFVKRIKQFYLAAGKQPEFVPKYRTEAWRDSLGLDVKDRPILKERPPVKRKERPVAKRPKRPRRSRDISTPAGVVCNGSLIVKGNKGFRKVKEEPIMPLERTGRGDGNDASTILSADLTGEGEAMWTCKHGCGTTLGYDALVEHEKICPGGSSYSSSDSEPEGMVDTPGSGLKRDAAQPDAIDNKEGRSPRPKDEGRFECNCQYNCGLSGSLEEILRHEEHCDLRVGGPSSGAEGE